MRTRKFFDAQTKESELLKLLERRQDMLFREQKGWSDEKASAVALHAQAHNSDPFAGQRMALYLRQGYDVASEVAGAARRLLSARIGYADA
jgi:hypothetical protein